MQRIDRITRAHAASLLQQFESDVLEATLLADLAGADASPAHPAAVERVERVRALERTLIDLLRARARCGDEWRGPRGRAAV